MSGIIRNGVIGAILVFICLVLVFDLRVATWITAGIPLSFVGSLLFFGPADLTLNMGTIFGFFLMVGIVVDDAVVVGESIATERESGKSSLDAAISGARAVVGPITIGVLTTVLGFLPFLFITAGSYQIVNVFPYVALFVLAVSLVEAFFILPAHLSHEGRWSVSPLSDIQDRVRNWLDGVRDRSVVPAVSWSVRNISKVVFEILGLLVPIVLLAMYALMAAFLRSYWKPLVAVVGIPLGFAGSVWGHWLLGWDFTAMSLFGVVAVAGVLVNDALVLLDRYNRIRREDGAIPAIAAASAATRHRFRAVFLTSLTTVLGLSPLLYERSDELMFLVPFVISMLGGLVLSGLFILFILPTLVMIAEGRHE